MATLEDKILGEKLQNYCSSSEGSDNEDSGDESRKSKAPVTTAKTPLDVNKWEGSSTNTGPKGYKSNYHKRTEKAGGSIKMHGVCPSRLIIKLYETGQTIVKFFKSHAGHEEEIRTQHLSNAEKSLVVQKLVSGVTSDRIIADARKVTTSKLERSNVINRKDIAYLTKKHNVTKRKHEHTMTAVALKVKEWNANKKQYCFFFKQPGVIEDWRKFKQLEIEKHEENERERVELAKKLTMTVQTALDEERQKAALEDPELAELLNDDFLLNYQKQRMEEMLQQTNLKKKFGALILLRNSQEFLDAIDKEDKTVTIIVHIYEDHVKACRSMNECLQQLCKIYDTVKFTAIVASLAGVSKEFKVDGVPALLVYKAGNIIGNFVKLSNDLGNNFQTEDVQGFLIEHGLLEDKSLTPALIKSSAADDTDSD